MPSPFPGMDPYEDIDYSVAPEPPLNPEDTHWAEVLLRQMGRRAEQSGAEAESP